MSREDVGNFELMVMMGGGDNFQQPNISDDQQVGRDAQRHNVALSVHLERFDLRHAPALAVAFLSNSAWPIRHSAMCGSLAI